MAVCVVTGGAGFLGSHLCEHLLELGDTVICIDNLDTGSLENIEHIGQEEFVFIEHDITEFVTVDGPVDFIYHLASPASPIDYARLPLHTLKVGSYGTHHMLGVAKKKRARFLLTSTSEVYGDPEVHPQPESYWGHVNPIGPRGVYDEAKRYAEALTMAYHRQQGVDTRIARIFNSILADEQVLYDDGRELRRETVAEAAARMATSMVWAGYRSPVAVGAAGAAGADTSPAAEYALDGCSVPAFSDGGRVVAAPAVSLIAHPTSQRCFEVSTRYGRSIRVTGDHSVFVEGADGQPTPKPVDDLAPGERIAIARRIEVPERDRIEIDMMDVWRHAECDPWDLCVESGELGPRAWDRRHDLFGLLVSQRRNSGPNWRNGAWTKLIRMRRSGRLPLPVMHRLGEPAPAGARVRARRAARSLPARIPVTNDLLWLLGLWAAEGSRHESPGNAFLTIGGDETLLARAAAIIERDLGLQVGRAPASEARAASIFVDSALLLRLMDYLGFAGNRKRIPGWILGLPLSRLKWFIEGYREGDGVHSSEKLEAGIGHEFSTVDDELKDDLIVAFARFGMLPSVARYEPTLRHKTGDRRYPRWRLTLANVTPWSPLAWDSGVTQKLDARCTGDLVWARVQEIQEIPATELVYDFSVPGLENFWAGTGVMAHNTYGPRMRPHDGRAIPTFLRQALQDKPLTVFGDGGQTRSFCYVQDLIRGLVALMSSEYHQPVNLGNPIEMTLLELAETVIEVTGSRSEIVFEALPQDDPKVRQPDITLAREVLEWGPEVELADGLRMTIEQSGIERLMGAR